MGILNGRNEHTGNRRNGYTGNRHTEWEMGILDGDIGREDIYGHTERLGGLGLGPIRKLVCNGREALFLAFLERFQCRNSCTANFLVI
jgi:hypothetical protein